MFRSRALVVAMACIGTPAIALNWLATLTDLGDVLETAALVWLGAFLLFTVSVMIASILTARRVSAHVLCRAVSAYLLIGIAWASLYQMLIHLDPAALDPPQAKGAWDVGTMVNVEELDPDPFIELLNKIGLPTKVSENPAPFQLNGGAARLHNFIDK